MAPRKRPKPSDDFPEEPRRSTRVKQLHSSQENDPAVATTSSGAATPTVATTTAATIQIAETTPAVGSSKSKSSGKPQPYRSGKSLSGLQLDQNVVTMVDNPEKAELMILELMRKYSFSLINLDLSSFQHTVSKSAFLELNTLTSLLWLILIHF